MVFDRANRYKSPEHTHFISGVGSRISLGYRGPAYGNVFAGI